MFGLRSFSSKHKGQGVFSPSNPSTFLRNPFVMLIIFFADGHQILVFLNSISPPLKTDY